MMMKVDVLSLENKKVGDIALPEDIFGSEIREDIISRVIHWQLAKRRSGTHSVRTVSEVSGTTKKPHAQKGTGRARQGSLRSAQMRGGGAAHGKQPRDYGYKLPKKIRQMGLKAALAAKLAENKLIVLDSLNLKTAKTADFAGKIGKMFDKSVLMIDGSAVDENLLKAANNLIGVNVLPTQGANVYDIIRHNFLILSKEAVESLEKRLK